MATGGIPPELEAIVHKRGHAVFIVNVEKRSGAKVDYDNLNAVFVHKLGFNLIKQDHMNLTIDKWDHAKAPVESDFGVESCVLQCPCLRCQIQTIDHSNSDCFVLAISSHGKERKRGLSVKLSDGKPLYVSEIMEVLSDEKCPTLIGKPRILILQMCRSNVNNPENLEDRGAEIQVLTKRRETQGPDDPVRVTVIPVPEKKKFHLSAGEPRKDFLIVYAVPPGKRSKRNTDTGSWMLRELKNVTDHHDMDNDPMDFLKVLTKVAGNVSRLETTVYKKDEHGHNVVDDKDNDVLDEERSGMKNAVCISHKLTTSVIFYPQEKKPKMPTPNF